mmetsp:Transcript_47863/g.138415  ORF Transcript_47863/g.138415 Transcript_47863/m.138415 type:complete len:297 (-) Transcript_47863:324-1214(-)
MVLPADSSTADSEAPAGKRRWLPSARRDDGIYYSFNQWLEFFGGDEFRTRDVWSRCVDEETENYDSKASVRKRLKTDIEGHTAMDFYDLARGGVCVVLQAAGGGAGDLGNSLRMNERRAADFLGGSGCRATLSVKAVHSLQGKSQAFQVRFQTSEGAYLHFDKAGEQLTFRGWEEDEGTIFRIEPDTSWPWVVLSHKDGLRVRVFPRWAWQPSDGASWWHPDMLNRARSMVATDQEFRGRRRHPMDTEQKYHTFVEWVEFADREWLSETCPIAGAALYLAAQHWKDQCIKEEGDTK